ncbi:MAG: TonB-dependent receptor [Alphaproteobacteria bacterium]|nr:TonB-dependent receptor [Alphaproteobacteria bacterium]
MRALALCLAAVSLAASAFASDDIVVTAERRAIAASRVPSNAAALSAADLEAIGAQAGSEALNRFPGVAIHRGSGMESLPAIRSPVLTGGQGAGSFLILEDGVPIRAPGFANINQLFETSLDFAGRVEVTRGPGSALYGANAVHGLVNVLTPKAGDGDRIEVELGQWGRRRVTGRADHGPFIAALDARKEEGWRDQAGLEEQHALVGFDLERASWTLAGRIAAVNLAQETAGFVEGTNAYRDRARARANANPEAYRDSRALRAHLTANRYLGEGWRLQVTPFARTIDTDLLLHFLPSRALEETAQRGGGVQTALYYDPNPDVSLAFGVDADRTRATLRETQSRATQPAGYVRGLHYDYAVEAEVLALYAQANWAFTPGWRLVAGARGERTTYDYDNRAPTGDVGRFRRVADRRDRFETVTPKLGLIREFGDWEEGGQRGSAWLNFARGARAPQAADLYSLQTLQQPGDQKAETIDSVELGSRFLLGGARIEAAVYAMEKDNAAFRNADGFTVPFAKARHRGVELSAEAPLTTQLSLSGWVSYARHTYAFSDPSTRAGESIRSGDDVDTAPRWTSNIRATWRPTMTTSTELEWVHMGRYFTNAANTRVYPGHDVLNLRARLALSPRVDLAAAVRNVTDKAYAERADFAFGADRYFPAEPRTFSVSLALKR